MGNMHCPPTDASQVASFARDICPFPSYNPSPHFSQMLSINSLTHLKSHYTEVQTSLTPEQLEDFTRGLRTTFGREGKVSLGGTGVVALSLAVLFDTIAKQVRGEPVAESGPISGLFVKDLNGYYPPQVYTVSKYLRLVPHIANNPTQMRKATERCINQLAAEGKALDKLGVNHALPLKEDVTLLNLHVVQLFEVSLKLHLRRITDGAAGELRFRDLTRPKSLDPIFNFNCDPEVADKDFLGAIEKSDNRTKEAFESCKPKNGTLSTTWLQHAAQMEWADAIFISVFTLADADFDDTIARKQDFDLKANALGKWEGQFPGQVVTYWHSHMFKDNSI